MAIVVEQEKRSSNLLLTVGWIAIVVTLLVLIYFLFFKQQELIPVQGPSDFKRTSQVSELELNPGLVLDANNFKDRNLAVPLPGEGDAGRVNPFLSY